jgi:polyphosphate kinase 2
MGTKTSGARTRATKTGGKGTSKVVKVGKLPDDAAATAGNGNGNGNGAANGNGSAHGADPGGDVRGGTKKRSKKGKGNGGSSGSKSTGFTLDDLEAINSRRGLEVLLGQRKPDVRKALATVRYEEELRRLQVELVKLQRDVQDSGRRIAVIFEGRDAAGKGGTIRRFTEHLSPRGFRVVALGKPTEVEQGQWYFQRYAQQLPNPGEIVFFDRSWYNRAVVEPVMGFCTDAQYRTYMQQVPEFEHMLYEDGIELIKFWFSISKDEQAARFASRRTDPLKQWKLSPVDQQAQDRWDQYTSFKEAAFSRTHTSYAPWSIVRADNKKRARLESIRYVLSTVPYAGKEDAEVGLFPDPEVVLRYHRASAHVD